MQLYTVSVVEVNDGVLLGVRSFTNDAEGIEQAEEIFTNLVKENVDRIISKDEMNSYIDDGMFQQGSYNVNIIHSA